MTMAGLRSHPLYLANSSLCSGIKVTDKRMDVQHIVTECGCVSLREKSMREGATLLTSIAHQNFRDELTRHAKSINLI
jgi:acyl-CoA hydrolase